MGPAAILGAAAADPAAASIGTASAAVAAEPDAVVIIDSPEFTHPIARRIRRRRPTFPSSTTCRRACGRGGRGAPARCATTSITCWRCCRSSPRRTSGCGGPPCTYVGHPLIERHAWIAGARSRAAAPSAWHSPPDTPLLVVLPGSRTSEVARLMQPFGEALARLLRARPQVRGGHSRRAVGARADRAASAGAGRSSRILLEGEEDKFRAFKLARGGAGGLGHGDARAGAGRHADGGGLQGRCGDGAGAAPADHGAVGRAAQPGAGREGVSRVPSRRTARASKLADALAPLLDESPQRARQLAALAQDPGAHCSLPRGTPERGGGRHRAATTPRTAAAGRATAPGRGS